MTTALIGGHKYLPSNRNSHLFPVALLPIIILQQKEFKAGENLLILLLIRVIINQVCALTKKISEPKTEEMKGGYQNGSDDQKRSDTQST